MRSEDRGLTLRVDTSCCDDVFAGGEIQGAHQPADQQRVELLLLVAAGVSLVAASFLAFKLFWPSVPEPTSATSTSSLLTGARQLTTGQIARGVFWGMWLFTLSQIIVAAVVMLVLFILGVLAVGSNGI